MRTPSGKTIPPTGRKVALLGSSTFEIKQDKVVHGWAYFDTASMLGQLGVLPPM
jgi:predicted ester cyclase